MPGVMEQLARPELLAMQGYSSARMEAGSAPVILNANENPWAPECDCNSQWQINRYPPPQPDEVVQRLADIYSVSSNQLLVTRGSDEGIDLLVRAFCTAGQDRVLYCPPTFGMYAVCAKLQNALLTTVELDANNDWSLQADEIIQAQPKLVFLCRPNNPTGQLISPETIGNLCQSLTNQALVIVDEAYIEFATAESMASHLIDYPNLVVLRTLSKAWGMAGLRCGVVLAAPDIIGLLRKIMAPYPLSVATQQLVNQALSDRNLALMQQRVALLLKERQRIEVTITEYPYIQHCWPSQANFLLLRVTDADHLIAAAANDGILIRNQSRQPGLPECIRISIGSPTENDALLQFLHNYREPV